jgi:hypothetical protein
MSLTKEKLFELAQPRFQWVEIEGFGKVGIQSVSRLRASQREASYRDPQTGELIPEELAKADLYTLVDQVMIDEKTPMFDDSDVPRIAELSAAALSNLFVAINDFNAEGPSPGK